MFLNMANMLNTALIKAKDTTHITNMASLFLSKLNILSSEAIYPTKINAIKTVAPATMKMNSENSVDIKTTYRL